MIFLGVLVILMTALVIGIVIHRIYAASGTRAPASASGSTAAPAFVPGLHAAGTGAPARLQPGEHIRGITAVGGDLAIWVSGPGGDRVLLLDPANGNIRVAIAPGS